METLFITIIIEIAIIVFGIQYAIRTTELTKRKNIFFALLGLFAVLGFLGFLRGISNYSTNIGSFIGGILGSFFPVGIIYYYFNKTCK